MVGKFSNIIQLSTINVRRKQEHLNIVLNEDVEFKKVSTGFEDYQFIHQALPEIDLDSIDLSTSLFGKKLKAPLIICAWLVVSRRQGGLTIIWHRQPRFSV